MKIRITGIRREPIDTAGLLAALVDLSVQLQRQQRVEREDANREEKNEEDTNGD